MSNTFLDRKKNILYRKTGAHTRPTHETCVQHETCVLAALDNRDRHDGMAGSKKLFLTLLGGDAFGNPQAWILDAIRRALIKFQHEDVDVFLVCYDGVDAGPRALEGELAAM